MYRRITRAFIRISPADNSRTMAIPMLPQTLEILAFLIPIVFPLAALALTHRLRFRWRVFATIVAGALSLPVGFVVMLLAQDPLLYTRNYVAPGIGVVAIPIMIEWVVVFTGTILISSLLLFLKSRKSQDDAN